jgi:radical SAM protein with 4Fe4S-binding SPASM domain
MTAAPTGKQSQYRPGDPVPAGYPTCIVPWTSICLAANGDIKPCCNYDGQGQFNIYKGDTMAEAWKEWDQLRKDLIAGEYPSRCRKCWKTEESLGSSRRHWMLERNFDRPMPYTYTVEAPMNLRHMDLNFGNTCNLKCRMCGSWGSTHWHKEDKKLQSINPQFNRHINNSTARSIDPSMYKSMEDKLSKMERIDFKGGEPLMQDGMFEVLQMLVDNGSAGNVELGYVTNGTKTPERLKSLWPKFKKVTITVSVEATGQLYQYIRGSNTQTILQLEQNLHWYDQFDNVTGHFSVAVSTYNIFDLQNLAEWIERVTGNLKHWKTQIANRTSDRVDRYEKPNQFQILVVDPPYLNPNNMPAHVKQRVLESWDKKYHLLDELRERMLVTEYDLHAWQLFQQFTVQVDRLRGTDVLDYLPQLKGEINGIN